MRNRSLAVSCAARPNRNRNPSVDSATFLGLLIAGSAGIFLSFAQARSRAVFAQDGFAAPARRNAAVGLLAAVLLLTVAIPFAGGLAGAQPDTKELSLVSVFLVHVILAFFLILYYVLSGRMSFADYLKVRSSRPFADLATGLLIGSGGWLLTILAAMAVFAVWVLLRRGSGGPATREVPSMILWLIAQPLWVRIGIVLSAMTIEEFFFRSFLQTRVGALAATLMFTAAHGAYGEPLMLVGILVISVVLSVTFALYGNVLACIIAHGVFDAIQMFVVIPFAVKAMPL